MIFNCILLFIFILIFFSLVYYDNILRINIFLNLIHIHWILVKHKNIILIV